MKRVVGRPFGNDEEGAILAEALIVIPVITIFAVGILEFGNVFWQRHLLEVGVRDAARYWSRCRPADSDGAFMPCTQDIAKNIAIYGNPAGTGDPRVPNWETGSDAFVMTLSTPPLTPTDSDTVIVQGQMSYSGSPLIGMLDIGAITISYAHEERYMGW